MVELINTLARFCGKRDIPSPDRESLRAYAGIEKADVMALFGGSVLAGGDALAAAIRNGIAETYIIVGGAGHTTEALRQRVHSEYPAMETADLPEAEIFQRYLMEAHGCRADYLETRSTNCGSNITTLLALMEEKGIRHGSVILCQDATMQARMDAGLRKYAPDVRIINYAAYAATVCAGASGLTYAEEIHGMWPVERYISLLMGEIPRLTDDENGYGPRGKRFIAHVEVPEPVTAAYRQLKTRCGLRDREANPLYASGTAEEMPKPS